MAAIEIALVLAAGVAVAAAVLSPRPGRPLYGLTALLAFAGLTAVTAVSMTWSIAPADSLVETARTVSYLAIFAAALAGARLAPDAAVLVLRAILVAALAAVIYALASRVWPSAFGDALSARLGEPFDYWNALGATAALAVPLALWLGTRPTGSTWARALAMPALGLLLLTVMLTQSRGALAAAAVATAIWLAVVPLRLRTVVVLAVPAAAMAPVAAWALSKDAFTQALQPLSAREAVAGDFGLLLLAMTAVLTGVGLAWDRVASGRTVSLPVRRRLGIAAVALAATVPLAAAVSLAASDRGLAGAVSDRVSDLTDATPPPRGAARLGSLSSSRGSYWRQAASVFEERPSVGLGAGTFGLARIPHREDRTVSRHAHGFLAQTAADLGLLGIAVVLALLAAWLALAARATGVRPGVGPRPKWSSERTALCALALCVVAFGVHSTVDWIWFVPGPTAMALVAAGFVAGRGPLPAVGALPRGAVATGAGGRPEMPQMLGAGAVLVVAALCAWAVWQPEAAARANDRALEQLAAGKVEGALAAAARAREVDPYSPAPLYAQAAALLAADRPKDAYAALQQAVREHPRDPETWLRRGRFELEQLALPERALETARALLRLDPHSARATALAERARGELGQGATAGTTAPG